MNYDGQLAADSWTYKGFMVVAEEGKYLFVHEVLTENTQKKTSYAINNTLFVKIFHARSKVFEG